MVNTFQMLNSIQPDKQAEHHLGMPHLPFLVAYLFLQVYLPNCTKMDANSPPLVLTKEYSNSFGLFSPISSPNWTTSENWQGDKLALVFPRKDMYKLLLQTVQEDLCNAPLAARVDTWLDEVVKVSFIVCVRSLSLLTRPSDFPSRCGASPSQNTQKPRIPAPRA